jgi:hypothetical protein
MTVVSDFDFFRFSEAMHPEDVQVFRHNSLENRSDVVEKGLVAAMSLAANAIDAKPKLEVSDDSD